MEYCPAGNIDKTSILYKKALKYQSIKKIKSHADLIRIHNVEKENMYKF